MGRNTWEEVHGKKYMGRSTWEEVHGKKYMDGQRSGRTRTRARAYTYTCTCACTDEVSGCAGVHALALYKCVCLPALTDSCASVAPSKSSFQISSSKKKGSLTGEKKLCFARNVAKWLLE